MVAGFAAVLLTWFAAASMDRTGPMHPVIGAGHNSAVHQAWSPHRVVGQPISLLEACVDTDPDDERSLLAWSDLPHSWHLDSDLYHAVIPVNDTSRDILSLSPKHGPPTGRSI